MYSELYSTFSYPFICPWILSMISIFCPHKKCYNKYGSSNVFMRHWFPFLWLLSCKFNAWKSSTHCFEIQEEELGHLDISYYLGNYQKQLNRKQGTVLHFQRTAVSRIPRTENNEVIALKIVLANFWLEYTVCLPNLPPSSLFGAVPLVPLLLSPSVAHLQEPGLSFLCTKHNSGTSESDGTSWLTSTALVLYKNPVGIFRFASTLVLTLGVRCWIQ